MIELILEYLKNKMGYEIDGSFYKNISHWEEWWKGYYKPFHEYIEVSFNGKPIKRKIYSMKMAKKVCEDWASLLLNEKTQITCEDEVSNNFLQGNNQVGGVLGESFWSMANELVEKSFYSGTGAFIARFNHAVIMNDGTISKGANTFISVEFVKADQIIPLTVKNQKIIECGFYSEVYIKGKKYIYLELHLLENNRYKIQNVYLRDDNGVLKEADIFNDNVLEYYYTDSDIPLFSILKPNIVNNVDTKTALGMSIFANAIDNLEGVDLAYNNFNRDFKLGGKKVFINQDLTKIDDSGNIITPDDMAQQLFSYVGQDSILDKEMLIQEHNPSLRVDENISGIQAQLDYLSFKCGLGNKHYQFNAGTIVTATQYVGDKQDLVQNCAKHSINIEKALLGIVKAILYLGNKLIDNNIKLDTEINIIFDDSYVIDAEAERQRDLQEVREGIKSKYEYRMKWMGETEKDAKKAIDEIDASAAKDDWSEE